jgi:hypothetical protein
VFNTKQYLVKEAVSTASGKQVRDSSSCRELFLIQGFAKQTAIMLLRVRHELESQCGKDYGERRAGRNFQIFFGVQEDVYLQPTLTPHSVPSPRAWFSNNPSSNFLRHPFKYWPSHLSSIRLFWYLSFEFICGHM